MRRGKGAGEGTAGAKALGPHGALVLQKVAVHNALSSPSEPHRPHL